jgi:hypothetical protein
MAEQQETDNQKHGGLTGTLIDVAIGIIGVFYTMRRNERAETDQKRANEAALIRATQKTATATIIIAWAAGLTFGAALIQACIFKWQLNAMQGQLQEMREQTNTTRAQIRANVGSEEWGVDKIPKNGMVIGWNLTPSRLLKK